MSVELTCLLWSAALGFVYVMTQAAFANTDNVGGIEPNRDREPQFGLKAQRAAGRSGISLKPIRFSSRSSSSPKSPIAMAR